MTVASNGPNPKVNHRRAAQIWAECGFSVIPIQANGTKKPAGKWALNQRKANDTAGIDQIWRESPSLGIGIVCGKVSGNLEMTELEGRATSDESISAIYDAFELYG